MINNTCLQIARGLGDNFSYAIGSIVGSLGKVAFWSDFSNRSFDFIAKKYAESGLVNKVKRGLKKIKRKLIG